MKSQTSCADPLAFPQRGYSATKHDENPAIYDRTLRPQFGKFCDLNSVGNILTAALRDESKLHRRQLDEHRPQSLFLRYKVTVSSEAPAPAFGARNHRYGHKTQ